MIDKIKETNYGNVVKILTWILVIVIFSLAMLLAMAHDFRYAIKYDNNVMFCLIYICFYILIWVVIGIVRLGSILKERAKARINLAIRLINSAVKSSVFFIWKRINPYSAAVHKGTESALREFLREFPDHKKSIEAQNILKEITEGGNIVDLLNQMKIEARVLGKNIEEIILHLRRLVPYQLFVLIPAGTYFKPSKGNIQNMVATIENNIVLATPAWYDLTVSVACANMNRSVPGDGDTFEIRKSSYQDELERLAPVLNKEYVGPQIRQAAIWIVTDNASYNDLGTLKIRIKDDLIKKLINLEAAGKLSDALKEEMKTIQSGLRVIREREAAYAMKICEMSGIDITKKNIWKDRQTILDGLRDDDADLKDWLENKEENKDCN